MDKKRTCVLPRIKYQTAKSVNHFNLRVLTAEATGVGSEGAKMLKKQNVKRKSYKSKKERKRLKKFPKQWKVKREGIYEAGGGY